MNADATPPLPGVLLSWVTHIGFYIDVHFHALYAEIISSGKNELSEKIGGHIEAAIRGLPFRGKIRRWVVKSARDSLL